jgi:putative transcriptional regulator
MGGNASGIAVAGSYDRAVEPIAGGLLVATTALIDPNFWRTVILVIHADESGHIGLVLNRPTLEPVASHLEEWSGTAVGESVVHYGGPVEPDVAIILVSNGPGESTGLAGVRRGDLTEPAIRDLPSRIYAGYAGWGPSQLQAEIVEGAWVVVPADPSDPFDDPAQQWERVLKRQGGRLALMSTYPLDVSMN